MFKLNVLNYVYVSFFKNDTRQSHGRHFVSLKIKFSINFLSY